MLDQASRLREIFSKDRNLVQAPISKMRTISVVSGKGGVGKTNITLNLAIALAKMNKRIIVFDADLGMANVDILLGMVPSYSLFDVLKGNKTLDEVIVEGPMGVKIIPGGSGIGEVTQIDRQHRDLLWQQIKKYCSDIDYLLIDCGAGITKTILGFISATDDVVVVLTPEPTSITDAYSIIKIISKFKINSEVLLVVNKVSSLKEAEQTANKIEIVANKYLDINIKRLGYILKDPVVFKSVCNQIPFTISHPNSKAAGNIEQLARNLLEGVLRPPKDLDSFIGKIFRLFG